MLDIKVLFMDVDGTLTDGKIYMGSEGELFKAFNIKDGYAIHDVLPRHSITPVIITGRKSNIVEKRCHELGIALVFQDCRNKSEKMIEIAKMYGLSINDKGMISKSAFIGDDILDLEAIKISEYSACPADAISDLKSEVTYICNKKGGDGAVREFIEYLINNN